MSISQYSTHELKEELKKRMAKEKEIREKEFNNAHRCRNCIYFIKHPNSFLTNVYLCDVRTWGKKIVRHYVVTGSQGLTCDKFEHKSENKNITYMDKTTEILKQKLENMNREELDEKLSKYKHLRNTSPSVEEYLALVDEIQRRNETNQHVAKTKGCGE